MAQGSATGRERSGAAARRAGYTATPAPAGQSRAAPVHHPPATSGRQCSSSDDDSPTRLRGKRFATTTTTTAATAGLGRLAWPQDGSDGGHD